MGSKHPKTNWQPEKDNGVPVTLYISYCHCRSSDTDVKDGKYFISWKDYRTGHFRKMRLEMIEFIRRFLLHVLPAGFFKVRYSVNVLQPIPQENISLAKEHLKEQKDMSRQEALEDEQQIWEKQNTVWDEILKMIPNQKSIPEV